MLQSYRSQGCPTLKTSGWTQKAERGALKNKPEYLFSPHTQSVSKWFGRDFGFINCSLCPRRAFGCLKKRLSPLCWLFLGALCHVCLSQGGQAFVLSQQMQMAWIFNLLCNGLIFFFFFFLASVQVQINNSCHFLSSKVSVWPIPSRTKVFRCLSTLRNHCSENLKCSHLLVKCGIWLV